MEQKNTIDNTVKALKNIQEGTEKLDPILTSVADKVSTVKGIITTIFTLVHDVEICCKAISTLKKIASSLSAVPVIGGIASVISKILEGAQTAANGIHLALEQMDKILKDVDKLLKKALGGLDELARCNRTVHDHIPEFTKTMQIIDYIVQIAKIVEPIVIGEDMKKRLDDLLNHLEKIENTASVPIKELNKFLEEISDIINSVKKECDNIKEKTKELTNAISNIRKAVSILKPVGDVLNTVINAIAPLKWVLDAADCLINKILTPVVETIMEATGLKKLVEGLEKKIMSLLGINFIVDILKDQFSNQKFSDQLSIVSDSFNTITTKWNKFSDSLEDFSPMKSVDMKAKMKELVLTVFNGVVDPNKPSPIPDWPDEPNVKSEQVRRLQVCPRYNKIDWSYPVLTSDNCVDISLFNAINYQHKEAQLLAEKINKASQAVSNIYPSLSAYQGKLIVLKRTPDLPAYFFNEIDLLKIYLIYIYDLLDFFSKLPTIPEAKREQFSKIAQFIKQQMDEISSITKNITVLQENIDSIVQQQQVLTEQLPSEGSLSDMLIRINSWPISLDHILDGYGIGKEHTPTIEQLERLTFIDEALKKDANLLLEIIIDITNASQNITRSFDILDKKIDNGINILKNFSPTGYIFPEKYLDKMKEIAKILHQLDAIFEPLLLLIEVLQEKEDRTFQNSILDICRNNLTNFTNKLQKEVTEKEWIEIIESILNQLSPISNILANLNMVNEDLNKVLADLKIESITLKEHIRKLILIMNTEKSYKFKNENISNRFFTQEQVDSASLLSEEIVKQSIN